MLAIILDNIRSTHNVGSIFRSADGFGVSEILICGYTPYPRMPHDSRIPHIAESIHKRIAKTALGAEATVPFRVFNDARAAIRAARADGYAIAALEQSSLATPLQAFTPWPKTAILVGNEINGMNTQTLKMVDTIVEIPMQGRKESFNVSVAAAIAMYASSSA